MARNSQADPRRMYSWWWDSHISPKNSKWLQENLTDMDAKVKQMIKVINEDADSFARRAEMYYKKRPELMKLVEEFYRAYRALAERYDHATGVIRQAHRQIAEAFPNQMPFGMPDDSPVGSAYEADPRTPDPTQVRSIFDPDELQKDSLGNSLANSHGLKRDGGFGDDSDSVPGRKGLKQLNDLFGSGIAEGKARKGLNFHDSEEKDVKARGLTDSDRVGKAEQEIESLKSAIAKLEAEKEAGLLQYQQSMERLSRLESEVSSAKDDSKVLNERARNAEAQVETLKGSLAKLQAERETHLLQYQQCLEKMSNLESGILLAKKDTDEISERASKAEDEAQSLKQELGRVEAEKGEALVQYTQCLGKISDLERELLLAEVDAKSHKQRADEAETEVETLRQLINKLTEEIDTAAVRYQQCMQRISVLEGELASVQEEVKRLNAEIDDGVARLRGAEERCLQLENSNQTLSEKMSAQSEKLTEKERELGRLWTCIQEERLRFVEAETAFQTLQHLHSQSQEELRSMAVELQKRAHILEDLEARNQNLQNEAEEVRLVNKGLNEVNLSSALTIQNLQDEISSLRETIQKLEAEVELRVDQRNALQQEIYCLKEELNELKKNHSAVVEQVESVGLHSTNFSTSVKDMQDENMILKEASERNRTEKVALLEKLAIMEKLVEKNSLLENSLTDLNVELEVVREKVEALEESCQHLLGEKSTLASEKATLVSELQVATENLEKLTKRNDSLENFLLDANAELEQVRVKSKNLEDLCQLLENEKLELVSAKEGLMSQLDVSQSKVADVDRNYSNLEQKYFSLEKERQLALDESEDLRVNLLILKQEHASLVQLSESQLADMASKICSLEKEIECKKKEYEEELDKAVNAEMEIFILRTFAKDLEEKNFSILLECQKLLEGSQLSKKLISELENENLEQHGELKSLFAHIEELRMKLYLVMKTLELNVDQQCGEDKAQQDKKLLDNVLEKLQRSQQLLCKVQDENQQLGIEKTVLITLIEQLQLEVSNLAAAKFSLSNELMATSDKLLLSQSDSEKLTTLTEELRLKVMEGEQNEQVLKIELSKLQEELLHTVEAKKNLQEKSFRLLDEHTHLMQSFSDLKEQKFNLEEENCAIFAESLSQSILSWMYRDVIHGHSATIKHLNDSLDKLSDANINLSEKVQMMDGKLERLGVIEIERLELQRELANMKCKYDEVEISRAEGEKRFVKLSDDYDQRQRVIECLQETNHKLEKDMCKVRDELLEATRREDSLKHELEERRLEISEWEFDISATLSKLQMSTVREALFEGKVHELIEAYESLDNRNCSNTIEIQQLKERVGTLEGENGELKAQKHACIPAFVSLRDSVISLENYTTQCDTHYGTESKEAKVALQDDGEQMDEQSRMDSGGLLDLQELQIRIKTIEKTLMEKEHEVWGGNSKVGGKARNGGRLQKHSQEISEEGHEVMTKDIMLDQISECSSYGLGRRETDQMMEIWETADQDGSIDLTVGKTEKVNSVGVEKKHKKQNPSAESLVDKEVSVDKLEISKRFSGTTQETSGRKILERLDSDAQKLTNLQITVQDLMKKVDITEKSKKGKDIEYHSVREQLGESEDAIQKLFDLNRKLVKNIGEDPVYSEEKEASASDAKSRVKKRSIAEQARRGSEKIGRLQLEVQKLQFLLLKLDESRRGKAKIVDRKSRVLLRDYLYGGGLRSGSSQSRKKGHFCACVQPPTKGD